METNTPEPAFRASLRQTAASLEEQAARVSQLTLHDEDGQDYAVPLAAAWLPLPGRAGVQVYHIPAPGGEPGLFMTVFSVAPGSEYSGAHLDESRLVGLLSGDLECNGQTYRPGQFLWLAPGEPTNWRVRAGALGCVLYDVPPHDIDPDLLPIS
jgi:hypothetical protein